MCFGCFFKEKTNNSTLLHHNGGGYACNIQNLDAKPKIHIAFLSGRKTLRLW
jgi:hypothetical protein